MKTECNNVGSAEWKHWVSLIMTIAMTYYTRVDPNNKCATPAALASLIDTYLKNKKVHQRFPELYHQEVN